MFMMEWFEGLRMFSLISWYLSTSYIMMSYGKRKEVRTMSENSKTPFSGAKANIPGSLAEQLHARLTPIPRMKKALMRKIDRSKASSPPNGAAGEAGAASNPAGAPIDPAAEVKAKQAEAAAAAAAASSSPQMDQLRELMSSQPSSAVAFLTRSRAFGALGQWDAAAADCSGALERGQSESLGASFTARAYCMRGAAYGKLGRQDAATEDFSHAIEADARCVDALDVIVGDNSRSILVFLLLVVRRACGFRYHGLVDRGVYAGLVRAIPPRNGRFLFGA